MATTTRTWSPQQTAIFNWFRTGHGNLVVRARAGTGKTSSIIEAIEHAPETSVILCAFNKRIAVELQQRLRRQGAEAKTLHSIGFKFCARQLPGVKVDDQRGFRLARLAMGVSPSGDRAADREAVLLAGSPRKGKPSKADRERVAPYLELADELVGMVAKVASRAKGVCPFVESPADLVDIAYDADAVPDEELECIGWTVERVAEYAYGAMMLAQENDGTIDFSDMIYLPVVKGWAARWWSLVCVDECLPYHTPVLLADGTSRSIGDIVEKRLPVDVMSHDTATGKPAVRRVTNWHKLPNRKPLIKISTRISGNTGPNFVVCTTDHKVWTSNRGWCQAGMLRPGDTVQVETSAAKSQAYKTTTKGRQHLGELRACKDRPTPRPGKITVRGGNGHGPTKAESALHEALGEGWVLNHVVPTGTRDGCPGHYKLDIAHPSCQIAIEIDGHSHAAIVRKEQDARKDAWLIAHGWRIFRFSNRDAWQRPQECAAVINSDGCCPMPSTVVAVEPVTIRDDYVYDISVDGTQCFYANGILVHNCQDMNAAQLLLATMICRRGGRLVMVGDDRQCIYQFRGADSNGLDRMREELNAQELGLTVTYRCPQLVVAAARELVPDFSAAPTAPMGTIAAASEEVMLGGTGDLAARPGDFILSRTNAPLARCCMTLLRNGTRARVEGRDIGAGLIKLVDKFKAANLDEMIARLGAWAEREIKRAVKADQPNRVEFIQDQAGIIRELATDCEDLEELRERLDTLFTDDGRPSVVCSSVHRAKGLEAQNVFILEFSLCRGKGRAGLRDAPVEEANVVYVAISRAQSRLTWVK